MTNDDLKSLTESHAGEIAKRDAEIATLKAAGDGLVEAIRKTPVATWPVKELDAWRQAAGGSNANP